MPPIVWTLLALVACAALLGWATASARQRAADDLEALAARRGLRFESNRLGPLPSFRLFLAPRRPGATRHRVSNESGDIEIFEFDASSSEHGSYRFSCALASLPFTASPMSISSRSKLTRRRSSDVLRLDDLYEVEVADTEFAESVLDRSVVEWFIRLLDSHGRFRPRIEFLDDQVLVMCDPLDSEHAIELLDRADELRTLLATSAGSA